MYLDPRIQERPRGLGGLGKVSPYSESTQRVLEISRVPGSPFGPTTEFPRTRADLRFHSLQMLIVEQFENQRPKCSSLLSQPAHKFLHSAFCF